MYMYIKLTEFNKHCSYLHVPKADHLCESLSPEKTDSSLSRSCPHGSSSSRVRYLWDFPFPCWHIKWCCHYVGLSQTTIVSFEYLAGLYGR